MISGPFVVDTNVLVAGLLTPAPQAPTQRIVDAMLAGRFLFLLSESLLAEYRAVLLRPRIRQAHGLSAEQIDKILVRLVSGALVRELPLSTHEESRGDQHLFALLEAEPRALLVSGDAAVLRRAGGRGLTPRRLVEEYPLE